MPEYTRQTQRMTSFRGTQIPVTDKAGNPVFDTTTHRFKRNRPTSDSARSGGPGGSGGPRRRYGDTGGRSSLAIRLGVMDEMVESALLKMKKR